MDHREERRLRDERERREREVYLANQIESDIRSPAKTITRHLIALAKKAAHKAQQDLVYADATDTAEIMRLQNEVRRYHEIVTWIQEAIIAGNEAWEELSAQDRARIEAQLEQGMTDDDAGERT